MDLLNQTKYLIKKTGLKPDKLNGQNFCVDEAVIKKMIEASGINSQDTVLEVGPGFGFLTIELLKKAKKVIAVELDKQLIKTLRRLESAYPNLEIVEGDILQFPISNYQFSKNFQGQNFQLQKQTANHKPQTINHKIVANLPYSITSAFLKKFLTAKSKPESMTLLVQKEVAERICARPGQMSLLTISVQLYGCPKIIQTIGPESFWPAPQVDSAILHIDNILPYQFSAQASEKVFWQVVKSGFSSKRKQLHNNFKNSLHLNANQAEKMLESSGINKEIRAQELNIENWLKLAHFFQEISN